MTEDFKINLGDIFDFAENFVQKYYDDPPIRRILKAQIKKYEKIYQANVSSDMQAIRQMSRYAYTGRKASPLNPSCPFCKKKHVIKRGFSSSKKQRFFCKDCRKTFYKEINI